jgi:hypothetical protein
MDAQIMSTTCKNRECDLPAVDLGYCKSCLESLGMHSRSSVNKTDIETDPGSDKKPGNEWSHLAGAKPDSDKKFKLFISIFIVQTLIMGVIAFNLVEISDRINRIYVPDPGNVARAVDDLTNEISRK